MTTKRKLLPAKLGAVLLILAMAAALLSSSALAYLPPSDVYATVTQGVNSYVSLASYSEYTVDYSELGTGAIPPGMSFLESGDTVALTGAPTQAGTYTGNGTVFYRSDTGGPDEQAEFTFTIVVEASATPTPAATAAPTAAPTAKPESSAATTKPTATPVSVPKVTKSPTGETVTEGSSCIFIARADGATGYTWYCTAADGSVYTMAQAKTSFPGLSVSGDGTTTLTLSNIPASLSGASFYCNFSNSAGDVKSGSATVTVTKATPKPSAKPTEAPDEPVNQNTHDHTFHSEWSYDEKAHWHDCDCGSRDGYEPHRVSDWATKSDGSLLGVCDVCGASVSAAGDPAVRLYYDFTNNSDERTGGSDISVTAKQSGFELVSTYALSQDDVPEYGNEYLYVYPGVTIRCIEELGYNPEAGGTIVFTLQDYWASDDTLTVEVDATDLPGAPAEPLEIVPVTDPHTTDGWATEGEYDDCYFTLLDYEVVEADSYSDCDQVIRFYFEYTNNGAEAESAWWNSNFTAYQDGIQLFTDSADDRVDADELYHEDIEPGETVTCAICFGIRSDSPVELMLIDVWDDIYIGQRADIG